MPIFTPIFFPSEILEIFEFLFLPQEQEAGEGGRPQRRSDEEERLADGHQGQESHLGNWDNSGRFLSQKNAAGR